MLPAGAARSGFVCEAETVQEPRKRAQLCLRQLTWRQEPRGEGGPRADRAGTGCGAAVGKLSFTFVITQAFETIRACLIAPCRCSKGEAGTCFGGPGLLWGRARSPEVWVAKPASGPVPGRVPEALAPFEGVGRVTGRGIQRSAPRCPHQNRSRARQPRKPGLFTC